MIRSFYTTHFIKKDTQHLQITTTQSGTPLAVQCSSSRTYFWFLSQRVSTCLGLHRMAVCDGL